MELIYPENEIVTIHVSKCGEQIMKTMDLAERIVDRNNEKKKLFSKYSV